MAQAKTKIDYKAICKRLSGELDEKQDEIDEKDARILNLHRDIGKLEYEIKRLRINGCQPRGEG